MHQLTHLQTADQHRSSSIHEATYSGCAHPLCGHMERGTCQQQPAAACSPHTPGWHLEYALLSGCAEMVAAAWCPRNTALVSQRKRLCTIKQSPQHVLAAAGVIGRGRLQDRLLTQLGQIARQAHGQQRPPAHHQQDAAAVGPHRIGSYVRSRQGAEGVPYDDLPEQPRGKHMPMLMQGLCAGMHLPGCSWRAVPWQARVQAAPGTGGVATVVPAGGFVTGWLLPCPHK